MEKDDFRTNLERALDASLVLTEKAQREQVERLVAERLQKLVQATAYLERAKASKRFGLVLFVMGLVVVAIAIYMRIDGRRFDSLITLMLSMIPLTVGGTYIYRFTFARRNRANSIEQLHADSE